MKKQLIFSVVVAMALISSAKAGEIKGLEAYGRVIYIGDDLANADGLAAGGKVKYEREVAAGLTMGAALHLSLPLSGTSDVQSTALADGDGEFYGQYELYAAYTMGATTFKAGQLQLDTPLAGSDDIRIVPNLMDVVLVQNGDLPDTTLIGAYVFGFNGWDSLAAKRESFKSYSMSEAVGVNSIVGDKGVGVVAAIYKGLPNTTIQAWDYYGFDMLNALYIDGTYTMKTGGVDVTLAGQFYTYGAVGELEKSKSIDYSVYGLKASAALENGVTLTAAYNGVTGESGVDTPFFGAWGGYPEYVIGEEIWMAAVDNMLDSSAYKLAFDYDLSKLGLGNRTISAAYLNFDRGGTGSESVSAFDLVYSCKGALVKNLDAKIAYEMADNMGDTQTEDRNILKVSFQYNY